MPVMDGFTLCRRWKEDKLLHNVPFVFYTATYTDEKDREFALSLGAERFILKPEEPAKLVQIILKVIEEKNIGKLEALVKAGKEDTIYYKQYNEVLINKLEAKMLQLQQALSEQKKDEEKINKLNLSLEAKVAERTAQLQNANNELESFSYSVSHDLKAPLRAIDGFSSILEDEHSRSLDNEGRRLVGVIRKNVLSMDKLIDDMLNFSRVGKQEIGSEEIDMARMAREVWNDIGSHYGPRKIEMVINAMPAAKGDKHMIRQVFVNLLSNAAKFSSVKETARIEAGGEKKEGYNQYYVKDNGAGFDMKHADRLFGVFQRLHKAADFEGAGVGLATVKRIVNRHGGKVWAESKPDEGATFYFTL
jgi:light-regulated signal transduction histidine kinase (bacteriophytochrome)